MNLSENKIEIKGLSINYVEGGSGQTMIFLHNGGGFWHSWEYQLKYFSKKYRVFGLDWPGFGESDLPEELISLDLLTQTLSEFIKMKSLEKVILIGNCLGGSAALLYNINHPKQVHKLIIFNICPGDLIFRLPPIRTLISKLNRKKRMKSLMGAILVFGFTKTPIKKRFPRILFGNDFDYSCSLAQRYMEKFKLESQTKSRVNMVFSVHTFNLTNYFRSGDIPNHLLVWGEHNRVTSLKRHGYYHKDLLKPLDFKIIKNAGHLCMYEQPEQTNTLITEYLRI